MRIVIGGASGFLGSALVPALRADGHEVLRLVRRDTEAPDEVRWDPATGTIDDASLGRVDAAINLAGAGVGDARWSESYRRTIRASRVDSTRCLALALTRMSPAPAVFLTGSGIGYYGDTGEHLVDETGPSGSTFLAGVVRDWEAAAAPAVDAGIRVAHLRSGIVMAEKGPAFAPLWRLAKLGLLGRLGSGRQWWSWIGLDDHLAATKFLLGSALAGQVNVTAPAPARNVEVMRALAHAVHRPAPWWVPAPALHGILGGFSEELLVSQRAAPTRLLSAGFEFLHSDVESAARAYAPA